MAIKQTGRDDLRDGPDQGGFCQFAGGLHHPQQGCSDDDVGLQLGGNECLITEANIISCD